MRKIILLIYILCFSALSFGYIVEGKGGFSLQNDYDLDSLGSSGGQMTVKFAAEYWQEASANTEIGVGVGIIFNGNVETDPIDGGNMALMTSYPIYGAAKYKFNYDFYGFAPYGKFHLGFSINYPGSYSYLYKTDPGLYIGFGAGAQKDAITVELMMETIQSDMSFVTQIDSSGDDFPYTELDVTNTLLTLSVGYQFDI